MLVPTHIVPTEKVELAKLSLTAGPRVNHTYIGGGSHVNTIEVAEPTEKDVLENWIVFHSFVTNSRTPIDYYMREGFVDKLEVLKAPSQFPKDYADFITDMYYRDPVAAAKIADKSYAHLFSQYNGLAKKKKALISNYLIDLNRQVGRADRQPFDTSYWQMVKNYSIIDKIIGQPPFCSNQLSCEACGASELPHHKIPARQWTDQRLKEIMGQSKWHRTYSDIICVTREKIRNASVHDAKLPSTTMPDHSDTDHIEYDMEKTIGSFEIDTHALRALLGIFESVTWYLLADYLFGHKAFGRPTGYSVQYIRVNLTNKPDTRI